MIIGYEYYSESYGLQNRSDLRSFRLSIRSSRTRVQINDHRLRILQRKLPSSESFRIIRTFVAFALVFVAASVKSPKMRRACGAKRSPSVRNPGYLHYLGVLHWRTQILCKRQGGVRRTYNIWLCTPLVCLSVYPCVCLSVYPFIHLSIDFIRLSVYHLSLSVYPFIRLSVYPFIRLSIYDGIRWSRSRIYRMSTKIHLRAVTR